MHVGARGDSLTAQSARRRHQPTIYLVQRPPPCSHPTPKYPGRLERVARQRKGGKRTSSGGAKQRGIQAGAARGVTEAVPEGGKEGCNTPAGAGSSTGVWQPHRSGPRTSSVSSPGVEELLAACLLPSFAIVSFLSVLVSSSVPID